MFLKHVTRWMARAAAAGISLLASATASAQSCAMCYSSAAAAKGDGIRALQHGIILLLIPPMLIFVGIFAVAFRSKERFQEPTVREPEHDRETDAGSSTAQILFETPGLEARSPAP